MNDLTLQLERFLQNLEIKGYSPLTQKNYRSRLSYFIKWLRGKEITSDVINYYHFHLASMKIEKATQNNYLIALRSFFDFLQKEDFPIMIKERIELAKVPERQINVLSSSQMEKMLIKTRIVNSDRWRKGKQLRNRAILEILFASGLRLSELCSLNRDQIHIERGEFTVLGKGKKTRLVFLSKQATYWLRRYLRTRKDSYPALFIASTKGKQWKGKRLGTRTVQRIVTKYSRKAKIPMRVTPHMIRHAYACDLLRNGANLRLVQELLGHKNITSTQIYTHITNLELKEGYEKFHSDNLNME